MSNLPAVSSLGQMNESVMGRIYGKFSGHDSSTATRLLLIVALAIATHLVVNGNEVVGSHLVSGLDLDVRPKG